MIKTVTENKMEMENLKIKLIQNIFKNIFVNQNKHFFKFYSKHIYKNLHFISASCQHFLFSLNLTMY